MATTKKSAAPKHIGLVQNDGWLEPFEDAIRGRHEHAVWKINQLTQNGKVSFSGIKRAGIEKAERIARTASPASLPVINEHKAALVKAQQKALKNKK